MSWCECDPDDGSELWALAAAALALAILVAALVMPDRASAPHCGACAEALVGLDGARVRTPGAGPVGAWATGREAAPR